MIIPHETPELREGLTDLRSESLKIIALFTGTIGYAWLTWLTWPITGGSAPAGAWISGGLLIGSTTISYFLRERHVHIAAHLLIWGILSALASVMFTLQSPALSYLFIPPLIFASVLLGHTAVLLITPGVCLFILAVNVTRAGIPWYSVDTILPIAVITLVAVASWLSARNLYVALAWVWSGYEQARQNEQVARERQAELRRALKALDEATYRLERANHMLMLARDQAEEARRLKQQFAQTISHELRTPLNLIVGFTELMVQSPEYYGGSLSPVYMRDLSIVYRNARHLQTLVNDVLDLARIEAAQMSLLPEETDPATLVQEAVNTARSLVEAHGLALRMEIEPDLPPIWMDPTRIRQVLFNLLNNAARFTERGGVTISARRQEEEVVFAVTDTGVGIDPEDIPRLFEEFHQLDGTTRRYHEGAGLGLAISRRFVEMHGGRIWVESRVGKGSTFYFSLPVRQPKSTETSLTSSDNTAHLVPAHLNAEHTLLAVTPSPSAAALLTRYVRGCHAVVVQDLDQARHAAQQLMPEAVVVDAACEKLDPAHLDVLAQAWQMPSTPFLACPLPGEEPLHRRLAADGYLIKPISRQNLWDMLRQFGEDIDSILIVDDDHDFVRMLSRMLDNPLRRYQVIGAHSGHEGLEMLRHHQPDLVLLDLMLPDISGLQVIKRVRSTPTGRQLPIVIVSARGEIDHLEPLNGTVCITKAEGLTPGEIVRWVQEVLHTTTKHRPAPSEGSKRHVTPAMGV